MSINFRVNFENTPFLETSTTAAHVRRLNWRTEILLTRNESAIAGKRVLDLASHDGRFTHACLALGARHVTGVEGRKHLVESARDNLTKMGHPRAQFEFFHNDLLEQLTELEPGRYDTILCFGFLYHTPRQLELLDRVRALEPQTLILDTTVIEDLFRDPAVRVLLKVKSLLKALSSRPTFVRWKKRRAKTQEYFGYLVFTSEDHSHEGATIDSSGIVGVPSKAFAQFFVKQCNLHCRELVWSEGGVDDWSDLHDYRLRERVSFLGSREPSTP